MQGHDIRAHRSRLHFGESSGEDLSSERRAIRELADGSVEVHVSVTIPRHDSGNAGQNVSQIEVVKWSQPRLRLGEFQHEESSSGTKDATHLAQPAIAIRKISKS